MSTAIKTSPNSILLLTVCVLSACSSLNDTVSVALGDAVPLDQVRDQLIIDLAGYPIETLTEEVILLGEALIISAATSTALTQGSFSIVVRDENVTTTTTRTQYDCPLGGTMIAEIGRQTISESSYSNNADYDSFQFNQCRMTTTGEHLLDGTVRSLTNSVSASRGGFDDREVAWTDFQWQQPGGTLYEGTALIDINRLLSFDNQEERVVTIDNFVVSNNGQSTKRISNGSMSLAKSTSGSGFIQNFDLDVSGRVTTNGQAAVQISTDVTLSASQTPENATASAEPFAGMLSMAADDGGRLVMTAQPIAAFGPKLVDITFTTADGETIELLDQTFPELSIIAQ